ncbi:hypothetical protein PMAYCL1PPCAC_16387, partial [Pristionchus mayeri]
EDLPNAMDKLSEPLMIDTTSTAESSSVTRSVPEVPTRPSSFLRVYQHGFHRQMAAALLFAVLRGLEMTCYIVIAAYIYAALDARSSDYMHHLALFCVYSVVLGAAVWA